MTVKKSSKQRAKKAVRKPPATAASGRRAEDTAAVDTWIAEAKPPHRALAKRVDEIVSEEMPDVTKAVKWHMLFWGREGRGWMLRFASWKAHASIRFYAGTSLTPLPPEGEPGQDVRGLKIPDGSSLDEKQFRAWVRQAAKLPGWGKV